jgi:CheY-like chemotaxis protein
MEARMTSLGVAEPAREAWDENAFDRLPALAGIQVLVVDDDHEVLGAISAVLQECGAEVIPVSSGTEALAALQRMRPDVLVSDIAMPGMDGHRLMRRIRTLGTAHGGSIPAAALTAYATTADRTRALLDGYQVYLPKPFEPAELACLVARLAGRSPSA